MLNVDVSVNPGRVALFSILFIIALILGELLDIGLLVFALAWGVGVMAISLAVRWLPNRRSR